MSTIASTDRALPWRGGPHGEAIDVLYEAIARGERLVVLTGAPGVGKTIVIDALVKQLSAANMRTARLVVPVSSAADLLSAIALSLRLPPDVRSREAITTAVRDDGLLTIVMDDAHAAGDEALAELGALLGTESRFAAVIAGDDTLGARLASALPSMRPLIHTLRPLDEAEGVRFIAEAVASDAHPIPTDLARKIWHESGGTPRVIMHLCRHVLEHPGLVDVAQLRQWATRLDAPPDDDGEALPQQGGDGAEASETTPRVRWRRALATGAVVGAVIAALALIPWHSTRRGAAPSKPIETQETVTPTPAVPAPAPPWSAAPKETAPRAEDDKTPAPSSPPSPPSPTRAVDTPRSSDVTRGAEAPSRRPEKPKPAPREDKTAPRAPSATPPADARGGAQDPGAVIDWLLKGPARADN